MTEPTVAPKPVLTPLCQAYHEMGIYPDPKSTTGSEHFGCPKTLTQREALLCMSQKFRQASRLFMPQPKAPYEKEMARLGIVDPVPIHEKSTEGFLNRMGALTLAHILGPQAVLNINGDYNYLQATDWRHQFLARYINATAKVACDDPKNYSPESKESNNGGPANVAMK